MVQPPLRRPAPGGTPRPSAGGGRDVPGPHRRALHRRRTGFRPAGPEVWRASRARRRLPRRCGPALCRPRPRPRRLRAALQLPLRPAARRPCRQARPDAGPRPGPRGCGVGLPLGAADGADHRWRPAVPVATARRPAPRRMRGRPARRTRRPPAGPPARPRGHPERPHGGPPFGQLPPQARPQRPPIAPRHRPQLPPRQTAARPGRPRHRPLAARWRIRSGLRRISLAHRPRHRPARRLPHRLRRRPRRSGRRRHPPQPPHLHRLHRRGRAPPPRPLRRGPRLPLPRPRRSHPRTDGVRDRGPPRKGIPRLLPRQLGHHHLRAVQGLLPRRPGQRGQQPRRLPPAHHRRRPHRTGPLLRTVHQPLPVQPARLRPRLLLDRPRRRHALHLRPLRARGPARRLQHLPVPGGGAGARQGVRPAQTRNRHAGQRAVQPGAAGRSGTRRRPLRRRPPRFPQPDLHPRLRHPDRRPAHPPDLRNVPAAQRVPHHAVRHGGRRRPRPPQIRHPVPTRPRQNQGRPRPHRGDRPVCRHRHPRHEAVQGRPAGAAPAAGSRGHRMLLRGIARHADAHAQAAGRRLPRPRRRQLRHPAGRGAQRDDEGLHRAAPVPRAAR